MNIFEALREDHDIQRALIRDLVDTEGDSKLRRRTFEDLREALSRHAMAEERHFYVPLMKRDLTQEKSRHSVAEHHEIDELVAAVEKTDYDAPSWLLHARKLGERVLHHLKEEEREVFQLAGKALSEAEKTKLADAYLAEMKRVGSK